MIHRKFRDDENGELGQCFVSFVVPISVGKQLCRSSVSLVLSMPPISYLPVYMCFIIHPTDCSFGVVFVPYACASQCPSLWSVVNSPLSLISG